jgi:hypothetical protein
MRRLNTKTAGKTAKDFSMKKYVLAFGFSVFSVVSGFSMGAPAAGVGESSAGATILNLLPFFIIGTLIYIFIGRRLAKRISNAIPKLHGFYIGTGSIIWAVVLLVNCIPAIAVFVDTAEYADAISDAAKGTYITTIILLFLRIIIGSFLLPAGISLIKNSKKKE